MRHSSPQARNCFSDILIALNVSDVLHIVLAMLENLRNCLEDSYPNVLIHIFPHFHYPFYRSSSTTTIIGDCFSAQDHSLLFNFLGDEQRRRAVLGRLQTSSLPCGQHNHHHHSM